jgi:hypothetical protein
MARPVLQDAQPRFDGGLNTVSDDAALTPNQMRVAVNARLTDFGAVTKRGGTQRVSAAAIDAGKNVQGGFYWRRDATTPQILVVVDGTLYTTAYGSFPLTWTQRTGALAAGVSPGFAKFRDAGGNDVVYIGDGGLLNKWNGTTLTVNIANTIGAKNLTVHNERLWSCGCSAGPQSVYYSDLNNGDTLGDSANGGGEIIVRTFGDQVVIGLASVNTSLLIFHRRGISRITGFGQDDIEVAPAGVTADVGTIAAGSIVEADNVAFFVSERGLYRCNEAEVAPVGTPEKPDPLLPIIRQMTAAQLDDIRAVLNRATRELWVYLPGFGVYTYHTLLQSWSGPWDTGYLSPETTALFDAANTNGLPIVLKGDVGGWVSLCDAPNVFLDNVSSAGANGVRYALSVQMHRLYAGDDAEAKALRWGYLTAQLNGSDQCSVSWSTGISAGTFQLPADASLTWGGVGTTWGTGTWGGQGSKNYRIPMGGTGYYIDMSIADSGNGLPVFSRFQLETFALGRR